MIEKSTISQGDRLALLRLYDEMPDAAKQELLRLAMNLVRRTQSAEPDAGH
jgi:hypothetical protein